MLLSTLLLYTLCGAAWPSGLFTRFQVRFLIVLAVFSLPSINQISASSPDKACISFFNNFSLVVKDNWLQTFFGFHLFLDLSIFVFLVFYLKYVYLSAKFCRFFSKMHFHSFFILFTCFLALFCFLKLPNLLGASPNSIF